MFDKIKKYQRVILASNSPRRRELLAALDVTFDVVVKSGIEEQYPSSMAAEVVPEYLACQKAQAYKDELSDGKTLLITADTVVIVDGQILGKPHDENEAREMLCKLQGRTHIVVSGVAMSTRDTQTSFSDITRVTMLPLSYEQIDYYISNYKPFDKAGAYGIQEWIGVAAISHIEGSYHNVMGLPTQLLFEKLI